MNTKNKYNKYSKTDSLKQWNAILEIALCYIENENYNDALNILYKLSELIINIKDENIQNIVNILTIICNHLKSEEVNKDKIKNIISKIIFN